MGYIKGSTKLLLCQILQGKVKNRSLLTPHLLLSLISKVYHCTQLIQGADLMDVRNKKKTFSTFTLKEYIYICRVMIPIVHLVNKN